MGLDVYLYKCADPDAHRKYDEAREAASEKAPKWSEKDNGAAHDAFMAKWDAKHPDPAPEEKIEIDSAVHPEHMFKIGYLRSSYNGGGIERVLRTSTQKDLHWIFGVDGDEYIIRPEWGECLKRAVEARDALDAYIKEHGSYGVSTSARNMFSPDGGPEDDEAAMEIFRAERKRHNEKPKRDDGWDMSAYSNMDGEFWFGEPLKVVAIIPGTSNIIGRQSCAYVVFEKDMTWYRQALQITVEMCEWVVAQPDPEKYLLHWSG